MILILDFGSQYTQLIARRIREANVYCEIRPFNLALDKIRQIKPKGIILSGGPASVYQENAPRVENSLFSLPVPFLGICYGMFIMNRAAGGEVARAEQREYGPADLVIDDDAVVIGSTNLDQSSFYDNYEANVLVRDINLTKRVKEIATRWIAASEPFIGKKWKERGLFERWKERMSFYLFRLRHRRPV